MLNTIVSEPREKLYESSFGSSSGVGGARVAFFSGSSATGGGGLAGGEFRSTATTSSVFDPAGVSDRVPVNCALSGVLVRKSSPKEGVPAWLVRLGGPRTDLDSEFSDVIDVCLLCTEVMEATDDLRECCDANDGWRECVL